MYSSIFKTESKKFCKKNSISLYKNNVLVTNPQEILQEEIEYFESLYSKEEELQHPSNVIEHVIEQFFPSDNVPKLSATHQLSCEGEITEQELLEAINSFALGKSPSIDGIPIEIYKTFF